MTLRAGTLLGHYEIRSMLGAGGMGEVYRAWDARLRREVAIKVLLPGVQADAASLKRFEQEARAAGALNHPNITAVYDIGTHDGVPFIVSERLEGETLRHRIAAGSLTAVKAIEYAIQIARGLSAAHARGIVHRDLKPANVFVCGDGTIKVLDFGIAKLRAGDATSELETVSVQTAAGMIIGTPAYMSPEQIRGASVDARSDIFSLGVVLHEMLAGTRPFSGDTAFEVQAAILREEPVPLPAHLASVDRIVRRCLEKQPEDRFDTVRDVALALDAVSLPTRASPVTKTKPRSRRVPTALLAFAAAVVGAAVCAAVLQVIRDPTPPLPMYTQLTFRRGTIWTARFAPDGDTIVYSASWGGEAARLYTTRIASAESRDLGVNGRVLSVSSAGDLAIKLEATPTDKRSENRLARLSLAGGAPRELLDDVAAASWDPEGQELAVLRTLEGRSTVEYPAGRIVYRSPGAIRTLCALPDHRLAVFECLHENGDRGCVLTLVDAAGSRKVLSSGWTDWIGAPIVWSPSSSEILFAGWTGGEAALYAVDLAGRTRLVARVPGDFNIHDVDRRGRLLMVRNTPRGGVLMRAAGEDQERDLSWLDFSYVADLSADGRQLLLGDISGGVAGGGIAMRPADGSPAVDLGRGTPFAISPDGSRVLAVSSGRGSGETLLVLPTGAGQRRELRHPSIARFFEGSWFADGHRVVVVGGPDSTRSRLYAWDIDATSAPRALSPEGNYDTPRIAPDGLAVAVSRDGVPLAIYSTDGQAPRAIPGARVDDRPLRWSPDGKWLFVRRGAGLAATVERLEVATGRRLPWKTLMPTDRAGLIGITNVAITPDGRAYAYTFSSSIGTLYLAEGWK